MEAVVLQNYQGGLSVTRGDVIQVMSFVVILDASSQYRTFYPSEVNGEAGLLPAAILAIRPEDFYVGKLSAEEAENFLHEQDIGVFLIRDNEHKPGDFILSVSRQWRTFHFPILRDEAGNFFLREEHKFPSLNKLVEHEKYLSRVQAWKSVYITDELLVGSARDNYHARISWEMSLERGEKVAYDIHDTNGWVSVIKKDGSKGLVPLELIESLDFIHDIQD